MIISTWNLNKKRGNSIIKIINYINDYLDSEIYFFQEVIDAESIFSNLNFKSIQISKKNDSKLNESTVLISKSHNIQEVDFSYFCGWICGGVNINRNWRNIV